MLLVPTSFRCSCGSGLKLHIVYSVRIQYSLTSCKVWFRNETTHCILSKNSVQLDIMQSFKDVILSVKEKAKMHNLKSFATTSKPSSQSKTDHYQNSQLSINKNMNNDNISDKLHTTVLSVVEDENEPSLPVLFHFDNKQVHSSVCTAYTSTNTTLTCVQTCQTPDLTHSHLLLTVWKQPVITHYAQFAILVLNKNKKQTI